VLALIQAPKNTLQIKAKSALGFVIETAAPKLGITVQAPAPPTRELMPFP
jgi:hypothetical protein